MSSWAPAIDPRWRLPGWLGILFLGILPAIALNDLLVGLGPKNDLPESFTNSVTLVLIRALPICHVGFVWALMRVSGSRHDFASKRRAVRFLIAASVAYGG